MVPPQFTAYAASWSPDRLAGCIGPYPSPPTTSITADLIIGYLGFKEATPKGIPHRGSHCLAPSGSSLGERKRCVLVFITVLLIGIDPSLAPGTGEVKAEL